MAIDAKPPTGHALIEAARELVPQIEAVADEIERERRLPEALVTAMTDAGLFRMLVPRSMGGSEVSLPELADVIETIAMADASVAWCLGQASGVSRVSFYLPPETAREIFGRPDAIAAWGQGPTSTAQRVPGGYRVNGTWSFASGVRHATWLGANNARLLNEAGEPELDAKGAPLRLILLVPAAEAELTDVWQVSGLRGTASDDYTMRDVFVPADREVTSHAFEPGPLRLFGTTPIFSVAFSSVALGVARALLDAFIDLTVTKTPRGLTGVLRERPTVQTQVAQAEATLRAAKALQRQTVSQVWQKVSATDNFDLDSRASLRLSTTHAIQCAAQVADVAYYAAGATAIFTSNPFERRFRDIHAVTQQVQGRADHYETVGRYLLGLDADTFFL